MSDVVIVALQTVMLVAIAPAVVGYLRWLKARLQNRRGADPLQPYREVWKTLAKGMVIPNSASWIFHAAPVVAGASILTAATLVPVVLVTEPADRMGDLFVLTALMMLGTVSLALGALDTGTPFGGMGSSREMTVAALTEPTLAIAVLALALTTGSTSLGTITDTLLRVPASSFGPGHALAFVAFFIALLAEASRLPVDNPSTHLELTMIHEAMTLEYSGPYLAIVEWSAALRLTVLLALAVNLFMPWGLAESTAPLAVAIGIGAVIVKLGALATFLAVLETRIAKLRLFRVPELLAVSFTLALLAAASSFFTR